MGNLQPGLANPQVAQQQNVQVQCSRTIGNSRRPIPSKLLLNPQQSLQQRERFQLCLQRHHGVHEARLLGKTHRLRRVERRPPHNPPQPPEPNRRRRQRSLRRPRPTSQVSAHPNVSNPHSFRLSRGGLHLTRMNCLDAGITKKVLLIHCQDFGKAISQHDCDKTRIVYLNPAHAIVNHQLPPNRKDLSVVRQKRHRVFNIFNAFTGIGDGEAIAVPGFRACADIP